ncbi:MAG TPA: protein kinase, partial [Candidatus Acidoferrales bacterium]
MGTPDYVSPEQINGKRGDSRSDLYAFGVILFEMLTGQVPFEGETPIAAMNQRLVIDPKPAREIDPAISRALEEVLNRAMERDPKHRYATAEDFAHDLEHLDEAEADGRATERVALRSQTPKTKWSWSYLALALIPLVIFALLLLVARQK